MAIIKKENNNNDNKPNFLYGKQKKLINKGLIDLFSANIDTFIDMFGGSGIVSMNTEANKYIINDFDSNVFNFYKMFKTYNQDEIISHILNNVTKFDLKRIGVKQNTEESNLYKNNYFKLGINLDRTTYRARLSTLDGRIDLGHYKNIDEAFQVYKVAKENYIKQVADEYKDKIPMKLYNAMYKYEVEITD